MDLSRAISIKKENKKDPFKAKWPTIYKIYSAVNFCRKTKTYLWEEREIFLLKELFISQKKGTKHFLQRIFRNDYLKFFTVVEESR